MSGSKLQYGSFNISNNKYFYKIISKKLANREIKGYKALCSKYPVARLIGGYPLDDEKSVLVFEYETTINRESGLLIDFFANKTEIDGTIINILELYRKIFIDTLCLDSGKSSDILFKSRIKTRLIKYYDQNFIDQMDGVKLILNGHELTLQLKMVIESIKNFFNNQTKTWCVLSQCDPGDLNIGIKPIILDYLAGGYNPLMAEFATFFWYQLAMSNYFALKYHHKAYSKHKKIYKKIDKISFDSYQCKIIHYSNILRRDFTKEYIEQVIKPAMEKIDYSESWYEEFKNYLAMRILCVFNVKQMSREDVLLSLGYLQLFYAQDLNNPKELLKFFSAKNNEY